MLVGGRRPFCRFRASTPATASLFSNRQYEVIWGDEAEVRSFEDRWQGGIQVYVNWMRERVIELHRILKPTGSFYLHCDWHAAHYLKAMLDDVFGDNRFQNEIIWWYRGGGVSPRRWGRRHDNIFFYTKGRQWTFNVDPVRTAYSAESADRLKYKAKSFRGDKVYDTYDALDAVAKHWMMRHWRGSPSSSRRETPKRLRHTIRASPA